MVRDLLDKSFSLRYSNVHCKQVERFQPRPGGCKGGVQTRKWNQCHINLKIGKLKLKEAFINYFYASVLINVFVCGLTPFVIEWETMHQAFGSFFSLK